MNSEPVRLAAFVAVLIGAATGCGRHAIHTLPALMVPSPPAHEPPGDHARSPVDGKRGGLTQRLRQSARSPAQPSAPRSAPMLGVVGQDSMPQATGGSVVITVPRPAAAHRFTSSESGGATSPAGPANGRRRDRGIALAVVVAGVLISAIMLVPRWTDRV